MQHSSTIQRYLPRVLATWHALAYSYKSRLPVALHPSFTTVQSPDCANTDYLREVPRGIWLDTDDAH
jgi:hypothetical protein